MSKNPNYVPSRTSYMGRIATKCRICGGQLTDPEENKKEFHKVCLEKYKSKKYGAS